MPDKTFVPVRVSLRDAMKSPTGHRELNLGIGDLPKGVDFVSLPHLGIVVPAVVGLRTDLVDRHNPVFSEYDRWRVTVSPHDDQLLRRLLGREKGELTEEDGVRYDIVQALRVAHVQLSALSPPFLTRLQICFAFMQDGTPVVEWKASSIDHLRRERDKVVKQNEVIRAGNIFGSRKILWWQIGTPEKPLPEVPEKDEWLEANRPLIEMVVFAHFVRIMQSLWKAEFADGAQEKQLKMSGYNLGVIGKTHIGAGSLREVIADRRASLTSLTYLGAGSDPEDEDPIREL